MYRLYLVQAWLVEETPSVSCVALHVVRLLGAAITQVSLP